MELEAENWRLCSTTLVRGAICGAESWELATLYNFSTRSIWGAGRCPTRVSRNRVPLECLTRVSLTLSYTGVSRKSVLQECPTRVSHKSVLQDCPTRVSYKSVLQECPTRVSHKSDPQECPTRVSRKSVLQECPARVSHKSVL